MAAEQFVTALREIPIDVNSLRSLGVSEKHIEEKIKSFRLTVKSNAENSENHSDNPIFRLINNYECSQLRIGMIEFDEKIEDAEDSFFFGKFEIDDLAINRVTGEVIMMEAGLDYILSYCASSVDRFLDAILIAAKFLNVRSVGDNFFNDLQMNTQIAEECGDVAGGEKYYDFYLMMFGV